MTTEFERTGETADIALAGRDVPRLVVPELNDPPAGDLELRPYEELASWRATNGPDAAIPGLTRTEGDYFRDAAFGFRRLTERPEGSVLAILHGYVITWITSIEGSSTPAQHAEPVPIERGQLLEVLDAVADDVFRHYSWETSGRPLLRGPASTNP